MADLFRGKIGPPATAGRDHPGRLERSHRRTRELGAVDRIARSVLWRLLGRMDSGQVTIDEAGGRRSRFGADRPDSYGRPPLTVQAVVHDPRTYRAVLRGGSASLGEA